MRYVIVFFPLLLIGCGQGFKTVEQVNTTVNVDPAFAPYVKYYLNYKKSGMTYAIPMVFADLKGYTVGLCTRWSNGQRLVQIDKDYWDKTLSEGEKYEVIAHELGHCDLDRDHVAHAYPAISIMDPYVFELTPTTIDSYMFELFNPSSATYETTLASEMNCVQDIKVE